MFLLYLFLILFDRIFFLPFHKIRMTTVPCQVFLWQVLEMLDTDHLFSCSLVCSEWKQIVDEYLLEVDDFVHWSLTYMPFVRYYCWFTTKPYRDWFTPDTPRTFEGLVKQRGLLEFVTSVLPHVSIRVATTDPHIRIKTAISQNYYSTLNVHLCEKEDNKCNSKCTNVSTGWSYIGVQLLIYKGPVYHVYPMAANILLASVLRDGVFFEFKRTDCTVKHSQSGIPEETFLSSFAAHVVKLF